MDAKKNLSENNIFSNNDDSEKNCALKKLKKHIISPIDNTEGESSGSSNDSDKRDHRLTILTNGSDDQVVEPGTELTNFSLNLQLKSSLKMITNIKQCIAEFENVLMSTLPEKLILENHVDVGSYKDFSNLKRKDNSFMQGDERKKRRISRDDQDYIVREKFDRSVEIAKLKDQLSQNEKKISTLEKELKKGNTKKSTNYISQSNTEYEDESDPSEFHVKNQKSRFSPGRRPKKLKNTKRSRGRPRKTVLMDDEISNSISEPREKKSRGRPRKSVIHDSSAIGEPAVKNLRGRPRKSLLAKDQSSTSINEGKMESDMEKSDIDSKKNESINSLVVGKKSRGRPKKRSTIITKLENASNIEMNENETREKTLNLDEQKVRRSRGRPKSTKKKPIKSIDANLSTAHRGRGRPKKNNNPVSDEDAAHIS